MGNKSDVPDDERKMSVEEGLGLAGELGCAGFFEVSAKTGRNVQKVFEYAVRLLREAKRAREGEGE